MSSYAADDYESVRRRQEEIKAERDLLLTGSSAPEAKPIGEYAIGWTYTANADYDLPAA